MAISDIPFSSPFPAGLRGIPFVVISEVDGHGVGVVTERVGTHVHVSMPPTDQSDCVHAHVCTVLELCDPQNMLTIWFYANNLSKAYICALIHVHIIIS